MTYKEVVDYLFKQMPTYQKQGSTAYKNNLDSVIALCDFLDNPQNNFKSIHIAGTNGKGSTAHLMASIYAEAGYKVGVFSSPHLVDFRERIKIGNEQISQAAVIEFVSQYKVDFQKIACSFFEWSTALAFYYFSQEKVDLAIIETGLGGRLDSTNVIIPEASVITNIGMDHMNILGETKQKIAKEKAGIIKLGVPVIVGRRQPETESVFHEASTTIRAPLIYSEEISVGEVGLHGSHQKENACTALKVVEVLNDRFFVSEQAKVKGLEKVVANTGLMGRWQTLELSHLEDFQGKEILPRAICDVAHNEDGLALVAEQLKQEQFSKLHVVFGTVNDKDVRKLLRLLPHAASYYLCAANISRALNVDELLKIASDVGLSACSYLSVWEAFLEAVNRADLEDLIFVGGSTFTVAEVLGKILE